MKKIRIYYYNAQGKLAQREEYVKNGDTDGVYFQDHTGKITPFNKVNINNDHDRKLFKDIIYDLIIQAGANKYVKVYGFSPNYRDKEAGAYAEFNSKSIFLNTNRAFTNNRYELINFFEHERGHLEKKTKTLRMHAGVYINSMNTTAYAKSTAQHQFSTAASLANYLYNIYLRENNSLDLQTIQGLIDKFNKENSASLKIVYDFNGPNSQGGLELYIKDKKGNRTTDPVKYKEIKDEDEH